MTDAVSACPGGSGLNLNCKSGKASYVNSAELLSLCCQLNNWGGRQTGEGQQCPGPVSQVPAVAPSCDGPAPGSTLWLGVAGLKTFSVDVVSFRDWCDGGGFENCLETG